MNNGMGGRRVIWKTPDVSADGLKLFACVAMLLYTIGIAIVQNGLIHLDQYTQESLNQAMAEDSQLMLLAGIGSILQLLGGLAVPVFSFLLVEGFRNTSSYRKYLLSMALFALFSEIPHDMAVSGRFFDFGHQNAMIAMTVCLLMLYFLQMVRERIKGPAGGAAQLFLVLAAVLWVSFLRADFGLCLVLLTAIFYLFYARNILKTVLGILVSLLYVTGPLSFYGIWCYTGVRKNRIPKYAFYAFYPLHMLVLGAAAMVM